MSDLISELSVILLNNFYSPKQQLHFHPLNLYFNFYLNLNTCSILFLPYKNCFSTLLDNYINHYFIDTTGNQVFLFSFLFILIFKLTNIPSTLETNILTYSRRSYLVDGIIFLPTLYIILALKNSFSKPTLYIFKHG